MTNDTRKLIELIKQVLSGKKGEELIDLLEEENKASFTADTNEQYYRIGRQDLVGEIKMFLGMSESDIQKLETPDSYDE